MRKFSLPCSSTLVLWENFSTHLSEFQCLFLFFLENRKCREIIYFCCEVLMVWGRWDDRTKFERIFKSLVGGRLPTSYGGFLSAEEEEGVGRRRDSFFENGQTLKGFVCRFYQCSKKMTRKIHHRRTKY